MARIGEMTCWNPACQKPDIAVHKTAGGKLSAKCHKCQFEHWGPVGTQGHRDMMKSTRLDESEHPKPSQAAPAAAAAPGAPEPKAPPPKPAPKRSAFDLSQLTGSR